jgi:hypothetical protein
MLTVAAVRSAAGRVPRALLRATAAVVVVHVALVWTVHYGGAFAQATRNGYAGFTLFHGALLAIVASVFLTDRIARRALIAAFAIVTIGALGAVFQYEIVAAYRLPVAACAITGTALLVRAYMRRRASLVHHEL